MDMRRKIERMTRTRLFIRNGAQISRDVIIKSKRAIRTHETAKVHPPLFVTFPLLGENQKSVRGEPNIRIIRLRRTVFDSQLIVEPNHKKTRASDIPRYCCPYSQSQLRSCCTVDGTDHHRTPIESPIF